jgi:7-cyano-7-deazaguanine synthase in queuosine biosynthesis
MTTNQEIIVNLWESINPNQRLAGLNLILEIDFTGNNQAPDWIRKILAHAMYHDYRSYPDSREIWIESLVLTNSLCDRYNWEFKLIQLTNEEINLLGKQ